MRPLILIAAATIIASCSRPVAPPGASLAQETAGRAAGSPQSCVSTIPSAQSVRIIDSQTLAYGWGRTVYINHLSAPCPGLQPLSTVIVQAGSGGMFCRGDRVRGREMGAIISGPVCILNEWVPYRKQ